MDGADAVAMLRAAAAGIMARGGASLGEKTLLDSLVPATDEIERQVAAGARALATLRASLDMAGASVTLVKLDDEITNLLAAPAEVAVRIF